MTDKYRMLKYRRTTGLLDQHRPIRKAGKGMHENDAKSRIIITMVFTSVD